MGFEWAWKEHVEYIPVMHWLSKLECMGVDFWLGSYQCPTFLENILFNYLPTEQEMDQYVM